MPAATTLWGPAPSLDRRLLDYTAGEDRPWDARLLRWDVLGSLGHVEGLRAAGLLTPGRARPAPRRAPRARSPRWSGERSGSAPTRGRAHGGGGLAHPAPARARASGSTPAARATTRSRATCGSTSRTACSRCTARRSSWRRCCSPSPREHRTVLWPGYTHQRRAMPSSVGLWAGAYAEGLLDTVEALAALWRRVDRSPLGSAAGYGVPLPLRREAAARALGFAGLDQNVAAVQGGRGKLEAAVLFWCTQLGHELARLSQDVILFSAEEFGYLVLPAELATGSSIMPHKRNPDLFELTRARAAALEADLAAVLADQGEAALGLSPRLPAPQGAADARARPHRGDARRAGRRGAAARGGPRGAAPRRWTAGALATDEVMRRVEAGRAFRAAYRDVRRELGGSAASGAVAGAARRPPAVHRRPRATWGWPTARAAPARGARLEPAERRRFDRAMRRLAGRGVGATAAPAR